MVNLKEIRNKKGFTLAKLSEVSGVPQRTIEDIERRKECKMSTAANLAKALGTTIDELWKDEGEA